MRKNGLEETAYGWRSGYLSFFWLCLHSASDLGEVIYIVLEIFFFLCVKQNEFVSLYGFFQFQNSKGKILK